MWKYGIALTEVSTTDLSKFDVVTIPRTNMVTIVTEWSTPITDGTGQEEAIPLKWANGWIVESAKWTQEHTDIITTALAEYNAKYPNNPIPNDYALIMDGQHFGVPNFKPFLAKYGRSTNYLIFKKADVYTPLPAQSVLLRRRFKVYDSEDVEIAHPTIKMIFESIDPDVMTYVKVFENDENQLIEYLVVPVTLSAIRDPELRKSEVEELNELARMQAMYDSGGTSEDYDFPGSTIMTFDELNAVNWHTP